MDIAILVVGIIGAIVAALAAIYAYKAWRNPVPDLDFDYGNASFVKTDDGRYLTRLHLSVTNKSAVPALIERIEGFSLFQKYEEVKVTSKAGVEYKIRTGSVSGYSLTPGKILKPGDRKSIEEKVVCNERPQKINLKIHTPNRSFQAVISDVRELANSEADSLKGW